MRRTKILYVSHTARIGGAEVCLLTLVKHLDRSRFEPVVVVPTRGPLRQRLERMGVCTYISPLEWWIRAPAEFAYKGPPLRHRVRALERIVAHERPALIHSNTSVIWEGALTARLTGTRHLWHLHENLSVHPVLRPLLPLPDVMETIGELSQRVVAVSPVVGATLLHSSAAVKLEIIANGIDASQFENSGDSRASLCAELGLTPASILALTVGSLVAEKGHDALLDAASLVRRNNRVVHFVLAGGGSPHAVRALRRRIHALKLEGTVHYVGFRQDVARLLRGSDLFVLPSLTDAFPLAVLEAMASGTPVVATRSGGAEAMVEDGVSGFLVPVADAGALADKVLAMSADAELRQRMGQLASRRFRDRYTAQIFAAHFEALYEQMLHEPQPPATAAQRQDVADRITLYENHYYQAQRRARRSSPVRWQAGRMGRWGRGQARKWMYEVERD